MARSGTKAQLLKNVPLFSACSDKELRRVAALADRVSASEGDVLAREGRPGREFFVLAEGRARVTLGARRIASLGPGDFFGEMALLDKKPRAATVTAETPVTVYVVEASDFHRMLDDVPIVARKLLKGMAERLREARKSPTY